MTKYPVIPLTTLFMSFFLLETAVAQELPLSTAGAPYAPLDVSKRNGQDPVVPLSKIQRQELLGEFKGLVHMGLRKVPLERWEGKGMADCYRPESESESWTYKCEIITAQGNGLYYFYPSGARQQAALQQLDIRIHAADAKLLDDFRKPIQELFGIASFVDKPFVPAKPAGRIRHWNTGSDLAILFVDRLSDPEGCIRFVWRRFRTDN